MRGLRALPARNLERVFIIPSNYRARFTAGVLSIHCTLTAYEENGTKRVSSSVSCVTVPDRFFLIVALCELKQHTYSGQQQKETVDNTKNYVRNQKKIKINSRGGHKPKSFT